MIEILEAHIRQRLGSKTDNLELVLSRFKEFRFKRNEFVLKQGDNCSYVYFIARGCLQVFGYDAQMNESTRDLIVEQNWCSDLTSFGNGLPATENIRAVEPTELLGIDRNGFQEMMQKIPQFDQVYRQILETSYANSVYRINSFIAMDALDRMKWLQQYRPTLMSRLPGKLIASYLGINKDVYSRLKAKL